MQQFFVGICGEAGCGKDTLARFLGEYNYERVGFSDALKNMLVTLPGLDHHGFWHDRKLKEQTIDWLGKSPRQLMQTLGTDWGRKMIHKDFWVLTTKMYVEGRNHQYFCFADVRFQNEVNYILENDGIIVRLKRPGVSSVSDHESEKHYDNLCIPYWMHYLIVNDGSVEDLRIKAAHLQDFLLRHWGGKRTDIPASLKS